MASVFYVSTIGSDSSGTGTIDNPWYSDNEAWAHVTGPGDVIYMRGGTYYYGTTGTELSGVSGVSGNMINLWAYPGEKPIINYSAQTFTSQCRGLWLHDCSYIYVRGIRIHSITQPPVDHTSVVQYGLILNNYVSNCIFEQIETDHIGGWGVHISDWCNYNTFINCDSHHNSDRYSSDHWGGADGFQSNSWDDGTVGKTSIGNVFIGCRAWANSDDGWDLRRCDGLWTLKNCWSFWNGYRPGERDGDEDDLITQGGNGEGFKLSGTFGSSTTDIRRILQNSLAFENRTTGIDGWMDTGYVGMQINNVTSYHNDVGFAFEDANGASTSVIRNCVSYSDDHNYWGTQTWLIHDHNSFDLSITVVDGDFASVSSAGMDGARGSNGELPILNFLKLSSAASQLYHVGEEIVGLETDCAGNSWYDVTPSIGAYENGTTSPEVLVTGITVTGEGNATTITVNNGTLQMYADIDPSDATDGSVTWSVTNGTGSAGINQAGLLSALTDGTVTVRATANDGSGIYGELEITISNQNILIESIIVYGEGNATTISVDGGTLQMYVDITPSGATNDSVTWSVINGTGSGSISVTGLLTAENNGSIRVIALSNDGSNISGELSIWITNQAYIAVTGITLTGYGGATTIATDNGTLQMVAHIDPHNATDQKVSFSMTTPTGAEAIINHTGLVAALENGVVRVYAASDADTSIITYLDITITNQIIPLVVPDISDFCLSVVCEVIQPNVCTLDECYAHADPAKFDPAYHISDEFLSEFRNYGFKNIIPYNDYGCLYNWYAANKNGGTGVGSIAPIGCHVPSSSEMVTLRNYLDPINNNESTNVAGILMKESGLIHWDSPNTGTNLSGFAALGSGKRNESGLYQSIGIICGFWNTRDESIEYGGVGIIFNNVDYFYQAINSVTYKKNGYNIRCLKNSTSLTNGQTGTVIDIDGNVYPTICIGTQEWMAASLKVTHYNDGVPVPNITDNDEWAALTTGAYCWYDNTPS
jgi:uncharacterized protein (TIGR02145 family)